MLSTTTQQIERESEGNNNNNNDINVTSVVVLKKTIKPRILFLYNEMWGALSSPMNKDQHAASCGGEPSAPHIPPPLNPVFTC